MHPLIIALGYLGFFAPTALGAIGSSIGCTLAGPTALGGEWAFEAIKSSNLGNHHRRRNGRVGTRLHRHAARQ